MVSSSLVLTSVRIMVQLADQDINVGTVLETELQTWFELHLLPTDVFLSLQVPTQDPTLYLTVMSL